MRLDWGLPATRFSNRAPPSALQNARRGTGRNRRARGTGTASMIQRAVGRNVSQTCARGGYFWYPGVVGPITHRAPAYKFDLSSFLQDAKESAARPNGRERCGGTGSASVTGTDKRKYWLAGRPPS
jgi:hypothetical protein